MITRIIQFLTLFSLSYGFSLHWKADLFTTNNRHFNNHHSHKKLQMNTTTNNNNNNNNNNENTNNNNEVLSIWYQDSLTESHQSIIHQHHQHHPQRHYKRRPIIAGNWKLNPTTIGEAKTMLKLIASNFHNHESRNYDVDVVIFPPLPFLSVAIEELEGTGVKVGVQNVGVYTKGAYTGEVAPSMVASLGCSYVMIGHSERRVLFDETDQIINEKVKLCLEEGRIGGLGVILCVGETEEEYDNELLASVVDMQIKKGLMDVSDSDLNRVVIAYEPVWAIGTGKVATPEQAQVAHVTIRRTLERMYGAEVARSVRIQYGGSVTPSSIESLMKMPDVDGALVGGASLNPDSFCRIVDGGSCDDNDDDDNKGLRVMIAPKEFVANEVVATKNVLGESPIWSNRDQSLYWISAPEEEVWAWNMKDPPFRRLFGTTIGCVCLQSGSEGSIVIAGERAFLKTNMKSGQMSDFGSGPKILVERPEQSYATRPNDGRVDRQGRLVFGMYNNYHRQGVSAGENLCGIYRMNSNLEIEQILDYKYRVSNCICFGNNGVMYFCDTPTRKVYAFDYPESGPLKNRRLVWTMPANLEGGPDGAQVDADGGIWMALSGAGRVVRVDPSTGQITHTVHLPVKSPTSVSKTANTLFVFSKLFLCQDCNHFLISLFLFHML